MRLWTLVPNYRLKPFTSGCHESVSFTEAFNILFYKSCVSSVDIWIFCGLVVCLYHQTCFPIRVISIYVLYTQFVIIWTCSHFSWVLALTPAVCIDPRASKRRRFDDIGNLHTLQQFCTEPLVGCRYFYDNMGWPFFRSNIFELSASSDWFCFDVCFPVLGCWFRLADDKFVMI